MVFVLTILLVLHLPKLTVGSCVFPITGTWVTSDKGTLSFSGSTIASFPTNHFGPLPFTCDTQSGNKYMAISSSFNHYGVNFEAYICLELTQISNNKYTFFMGSDFNATVGNERIKSAATGAALTFADVCDRTVYADGTYSVMIKQGTIINEKIDCPTMMQSTWSYTYDSGSGHNACAGGSYNDVCSDIQSFNFNYTICSQSIMYSATGILHCFYQTTIGSDTYLHVYNDDTSTDESTTYRFSCIVMTSSSSSMYASQYPQNCVEGQTSTNVSSPGAILVFTEIANCTSLLSTTTTSTTSQATTTTIITTETSTEPPSTSEINVASIAAVVIVTLLIVIVGVLLVIYFAWRHHQKKLDNTKPKPDPKYANGEIRNFRRSKHDGVVPDIVNINDSTEVVDETNTPRTENNNTKVDTVPLIDSRDELRLSLDSAGSVGIRRETSIVVSIPTSKSELEKVSETEEEVTAEEAESEDNDQHETEVFENTTLEESQNMEQNTDIVDRAKTKKTRKKVRKKKSSVNNKIKPSPRLEKVLSAIPQHGQILKPGSPSKAKASAKMVNKLNSTDKVAFGTVPMVLLKIKSPARKRTKSPGLRPKTATSMKSIQEEEPLDLEEKMSHLRQMQKGYLQEMRKKRQSEAAVRKASLQLSITNPSKETDDTTSLDPWKRATSAKSRKEQRPSSQAGFMVTHGIQSDPVVPSPETPCPTEEVRKNSFCEPKAVEMEPEEVWNSIANMWNLKNQYMSESFIKLTNDKK